MIKIFHIISSLDQGGAESALTRLVTGTPDSIKHIVISMKDRGVFGDYLIDNGVQVYELKMIGFFGFISGLFRLITLIKKESPDIIQTWMYHADLIGGIIGKFFLRPQVVWGIRNSMQSAHHVKFRTRVILKMCAFLSGVIPKKIVANSNTAFKNHVNFGYKESLMEVIVNGVDPDVFCSSIVEREKVRGSLKISSNIFLIGMVARWDPQKDHKNLLKAISYLKSKYENFEVILVGKGLDSGNKSLINLIRYYQLEDKINLLGKRGDIPSILNALDIHVLSSASESFPNVLVEAMSCGVPCISTNVGDSSDIVGDCGWIVDSESPEELSKAIIEAISESKHADLWDERKVLCQKRVVGNYSMESFIDSFCSLWTSLCKT
ncbi:MAG: glycosyltransferase [Gammaproteobacteria bacterium]|nr:MAG: glycosyltransferase [Gammaproteobacteria bacterium]